MTARDAKSPSTRVVIADDSELARRKLRQILERDGDIEVVGEASDGPSTIALVQRLRPALVTLDIQMPGQSGLEVIDQIMAIQPVPIMVVTSFAMSGEVDTAFAAISRGALDLALKHEMSSADQAERFCDRIRRLATVPVVRHLSKRRNGVAAPSPRSGGAFSVVGVAASAGGPATLAAFLSALPADFPASVAIVQHLNKSFEDAFVRFLQSHSALPLVRVSERRKLAPGTVYVACADLHMVAEDASALNVADGPPVEGFKPSASVLFDSLGRQLKDRAIGVVLTGMGRDGASGLARIRDAGGLTIAQSAKSATVDGMPRAAREAGAATCVLSLEEIPARLVAAVRVSRAEQSRAARSVK